MILCDDDRTGKMYLLKYSLRYICLGSSHHLFVSVAKCTQRISRRCTANISQSQDGHTTPETVINLTESSPAALRCFCRERFHDFSSFGIPSNSTSAFLMTYKIINQNLYQVIEFSSLQRTVIHHHRCKLVSHYLS